MNSITIEKLNEQAKAEGITYILKGNTIYAQYSNAPNLEKYESICNTGITLEKLEEAFRPLMNFTHVGTEENQTQILPLNAPKQEVDEVIEKHIADRAYKIKCNGIQLLYGDMSEADKEDLARSFEKYKGLVDKRSTLDDSRCSIEGQLAKLEKPKPSFFNKKKEKIAEYDQQVSELTKREKEIEQSHREANREVTTILQRWHSSGIGTPVQQALLQHALGVAKDNVKTRYQYLQRQHEQSQQTPVNMAMQQNSRR